MDIESIEEEFRKEIPDLTPDEIFNAYGNVFGRKDKERTPSQKLVIRDLIYYGNPFDLEWLDDEVTNTARIFKEKNNYEKSLVKTGMKAVVSGILTRINRKPINNITRKINGRK